MRGASTTDLQLFELPGRGSAAPKLLGRCSAPDLQLAELPGRVSTADLKINLHLECSYYFQISLHMAELAKRPVGDGVSL